MGRGHDCMDRGTVSAARASASSCFQATRRTLHPVWSFAQNTTPPETAQFCLEDDRTFVAFDTIEPREDVDSTGARGLGFNRGRDGAKGESPGEEALRAGSPGEEHQGRARGEGQGEARGAQPSERAAKWLRWLIDMSIQPAMDRA